MNIAGKPTRSLRYNAADAYLELLDQTCLPFQVNFLPINCLDEICSAIASMQVRGAPAIGATAAFGLVFQARENASDAALHAAAAALKATRPTAINLAWAVDGLLARLLACDVNTRAELALSAALQLCEDDVLCNARIGDAGLALIKSIAEKKTGPVNILTHCNAGWLATVDWGTALAPIYKAQQCGIDVHVWVDETRPRNQGAMLTAFELGEQGVSHCLISDNSGGHLMQQGLVDLCLVGSDRTTANGDVCNKIGTYLKALAAKAHGIPFYVALPSSTIDWQLRSGFDIPIEYRSEDEVRYVLGIDSEQSLRSVRICPETTAALNPAFDVTPATLVSALITEHGIFQANTKSLEQLRALL